MDGYYPRGILSNGPAVHFSSSNYETKHQDLKDTAVETASNVNLPLRVGIKHELKLCYRLEFCPPIHQALLITAMQIAI